MRWTIWQSAVEIACCFSTYLILGFITQYLWTALQQIIYQMWNNYPTVQLSQLAPMSTCTIEDTRKAVYKLFPGLQF